MKKVIAMLLVLVMAASAAITIAAETDTAENIDAPTILGYQLGDYTDENGNKVDGFVNVRFVSYVTSLDADKLGYEINAYYTDGDSGNVKLFAATENENTTTEDDKVFTSIYENNRVVSVTEKTGDENAKGFFLYSIKKIPATASIFFEVTSYAKVGEEIVAVSETTTLYCDADGENGNGKIVNTTYDFSDAAVTPADFGAKGKFSSSSPYKIENGKLVIDSTKTKWSTDSGAKGPNCITSLLSSDKLAAALKNDNGYHQSYVVSMDMQFTYNTNVKNLFVLINGNNDLSGYKTCIANGVGVGMYGVDASKPVTTSNKLNVISMGMDANATRANALGGWKTYIPSSAEATAGAYGFNLTFAYTYNGEGNDARIDIYINGTHSSTATLKASTYEPGLKFKDGQLVSDITLWSEGIGGDIKVDNLTVSVPTDVNAGVVDTATNALNALTETYKADYDPKLEELFGIAPLTPTAGKAPASMSITADGALKMNAGATWGSHLITLAPADMVNGDDGKVVIDMKLAMNNSKRLSVFLVNDDVSAATSYTKVTNESVVGYRLASTDNNKLKAWTVEFDGSGKQISGENKEGQSVYVQGDSYVFDIRIIADGSTYSLYVNGMHALTRSYADDAENKTVNANTSIVVWAENTEFTISDLSIKTFQPVG